MKKKITALLAILLLVSLVGCGNNIDNTELTPSDAAPTETIAEPSTEPTTEPTATPSTEPTTAPTQEPTTAPPAEQGETVPPTTPPSTEPTPEATQKPTTPPATSTPAPVTPAPSSAPVVQTPTPQTHTHSYTVTTKATCTSEGVETCSCGDTKVIPATGQHDYQPQTIQGTGHFEQVQVGTEQVIIRYETRLRSVCTTCGFETYDTNELREHQRATCFGGRQLCYEEKTPIYEEQPKYENQWVIDTPDQIIYKCSVCGQEK